MLFTVRYPLAPGWLTRTGSLAATSCPISVASRSAPPATVHAEGTSPKRAKTHSGARMFSRRPMSAHSLPDTCFGAYAIAKTSMTINTASPSARHRNDRERQTAKGVHANVAPGFFACLGGLRLYVH